MRLATLITAVVLAIGPLSAPAHAREPAASASSDAALQKELAGLQKELAATEAKAMQDPEVARSARKLDADLKKALAKEDPKLDDKIARLEAIVKELESKVAAQAPEGELMPLVAEGQAIQRSVETTQAKVLESEPFASRLQSFHAQVQRKMTELDPKTPQRVQRAEAIVQELGARAAAQPGS